MTETKPSIEAVLLHFGADRVPSGRGWRAMRCPFHDDKNASAGVNNDTDAFACHACDVKGDSLSLLMERERLSFREAVERGREIDDDYQPETTTTRRGRRQAVTLRWTPPGRRGRR